MRKTDMNNTKAFERLTMDAINAIRDSVRQDLTPAGRDFEIICAAYSAGFSAGNRAPRLTDPGSRQERAAARRNDAQEDAKRQEREAAAAQIRQKYGFTRQERPRKTAQDAPQRPQSAETAEKA